MLEAHASERQALEAQVLRLNGELSIRENMLQAEQAEMAQLRQGLEAQRAAQATEVKRAKQAFAKRQKPSKCGQLRPRPGSKQRQPCRPPPRKKNRCRRLSKTSGPKSPVFTLRRQRSSSHKTNLSGRAGVTRASARS